MAFNPALHPRDRLGRFRPTYVAGSAARNTYVGRGGDFVGAKTGAEFKLGRKGRGVLVKGIVGYQGSTARRAAAEQYRRSQAKPKATTGQKAKPKANVRKRQPKSRRVAGRQPNSSPRLDRSPTSF